MHLVLMSVILLLGGWFIASSSAAGASKAWNYVRSDKSIGPDAWGKSFPDCKDQKNSPIDIVTKVAVARKVESWTLTGWDDKMKWTVKDTNSTMKFSLESGQKITATGGNLGNVYNLLQFHFHWGATDAKGSEHTVGGKSYPLEVHLVHVNSKFPSTPAALDSGEEDAIGVLGFFFKIQDADNKDLSKIISAISDARSSDNSEVEKYELNGLSTFFGSAVKGNFFRYFGGFTTPACTEIAKWTVFETAIPISAAQMAVFRNHTDSTYGTEFYRPVQPLGSRTVILYDVDYSKASSLSALLSLSIFAFVMLRVL